MGLLDSVIGAIGSMQAPPAGGQAGGGGAALLMQIVAAMLANGQAAGAASGSAGGLGGMLGGLAGALGGGQAGGGGLGALLEQFQRAGLGDVAASWVASGPNQSITPEQLGRVFGDDAVAGLAERTGLPANDVLGQLSQLLPQMVDRVTPEGRVPEGGLGDIGAILERFSAR